MPRASHPVTRLIRKNHRKKKKKKKTRVTTKPQNSEPESSEEEASEFGYKLKPSASQPHNTLQVQPLGNLLLASAPNIRNPGLGSLHVLPDSLLLDDLLPLLSPKDLSLLSAASKALYAFSTHDPLWRPLALLHLGPDFRFSRSWRSTFLSSKSPDPKPAAITIRGFFSDYLFQSWLCANIRMRPEWLSTDNIPRRRAASFSVDEFVAGFEEPNKPVLIEGCLDGWPAMERWRSRDSLMELCGDARFSAGPVEMKLENYFRYADAAREERPLYLFDPKFAEKVPEMGRDYEVPVYFREDLFSLLGRERPDYRWVIIGPAGSGSSFHVDPNSTSAWNAVVKGSKKWVMFPPEVVPPGVHPSPDGAEVACPVSIMEWFMNFYAACRDWKRRPVECVCKAGEVVFVPNGWWHLVINLEDSIAITQNYVSRRNLLNVLDFLKKPNASELVSGTKDRTNLHDKFRTAIEAAFPGTIDDLSLEAREKMMAQHKKRSFWESVTDANVGGFKFSF